MRRALVSPAPPGGLGTMILIVFDGKSCAAARGGSTARPQATRTHPIHRCINMIACLLVVFAWIAVRKIEANTWVPSSESRKDFVAVCGPCEGLFAGESFGPFSESSNVRTVE